MLFRKKEETKVTDFKRTLISNLHKLHEIGRYKKVVTTSLHDIKKGTTTYYLGHFKWIQKIKNFFMF